MSSWSRVQGQSLTVTQANVNSTHNSVTLGSAVTSGNFVVGMCWWNANPGTVGSITVTDDKGNNYTIIDSDFAHGWYLITFWSGGLLTNGPKTITVTAPNSTAYVWPTVEEYSPPSGALGVALDGHSINSSGSNTSPISAPSFSTTSPNSLVWAGAVVNNGSASPTPGTGFTSGLSPGAYIGTEYLTQAAGSITPSFTGSWANAGIGAFAVKTTNTQYTISGTYGSFHISSVGANFYPQHLVFNVSYGTFRITGEVVILKYPRTDPLWFMRWQYNGVLPDVVLDFANGNYYYNGTWESGNTSAFLSGGSITAGLGVYCKTGDITLIGPALSAFQGGEYTVQTSWFNNADTTQAGLISSGNTSSADFIISWNSGSFLTWNEGAGVGITSNAYVWGSGQQVWGTTATSTSNNVRGLSSVGTGGDNFYSTDAHPFPANPTSMYLGQWNEAYRFDGYCASIAITKRYIPGLIPPPAY